MVVRLNDDTFSRGLETAKVLLGHSGFSDELAAMIRQKGGADKAVNALLREFGLSGTAQYPAPSPVAPDSLTVPISVLLHRLASANDWHGWGITSGDIQRLFKTVPDRPEGRSIVRSLRIRFGEGQEGVEQTANAHIAEIVRVHGSNRVWRWKQLRTGKKHLRLLGGNGTHKPVVEWCMIDLDRHRKRAGIAAVRGPESIADEGLVLAWLFPDYPRSIDFAENPGYILGGYELHVPEYSAESWGLVPLVGRNPDADKVNLGGVWQTFDCTDFVVPCLLK